MTHAAYRLLAALVLLPAATAVRGEVYQEPGAFVAEVLGSVPVPKVLWLTRDLQSQAAAIFGPSSGATAATLLERGREKRLDPRGDRQGGADHRGLRRREWTH